MTKAYQWKHGRCPKKLTYMEAMLLKPHPDYTYEVKESGCRYWLQIRPQGAPHNYLVSRQVSKKTGQYVEKQDVETKMRDFKASIFWSDTVFDGEVRGGRMHNDTVHAMKEGNARYVVWDIVMLRGRDLKELPRIERWKILLAQKKFFPPWMTLVEHDDCPVKLLQTVMMRKGEGLVQKRNSAPYGVGWVKIKKNFNLDAVIWGFIETKSADWKSKGWIGSVRLGQWKKVPVEKGLPCTNWSPKRVFKPGDRVLYRGEHYQFTDVGDCSGFTAAKRSEISQNRKKFLGKVIEVKVSDVHDSGKFCDPRFQRDRPDKPGIDCLFGHDS